MKREISLSKYKMPLSSKTTKQVAYKDKLFLLSQKKKTLQVLYKRAYPFLSVKDFKKETFKMGYKPLSDQVHHKKKALTRTASLILQKSSHSKKKLHKKKLQKLVQVFYKLIFKGRVYGRLLSSLVGLRSIACLYWKVRAIALKKKKVCLRYLSKRVCSGLSGFSSLDKPGLCCCYARSKASNSRRRKKQLFTFATQKWMDDFLPFLPNSCSFLSLDKKFKKPKNNGQTSFLQLRKNKSIFHNKKGSQPDSQKKRMRNSHKESRALKSFKKTHFFLSPNRVEQKMKVRALLFLSAGRSQKKESCPVATQEDKCLLLRKKTSCSTKRSKKEKQSILASFFPLRSLDLIEKAVEEVQPYIEPRTIRRGKRKKRVVPLLISNNRAKSLAVKWLIQAAKKRQTTELDLSQSLALEILDALNKRGEPRQRRDRLHKLARSNRDNARFSWW